jgi:hypothetical protein
MALESARILPLTEVLSWDKARVPGTTLSVVQLTQAIDTINYAARDFELEYRDLVVAAALSEVALKASDVWGFTIDRPILPSIPGSVLESQAQDLPDSLAMPGSVAHVVPSSIPKDAVDTDRDLYGRDLIMWEAVARIAAVFQSPPVDPINPVLTLGAAWSLAEGANTKASVNPAIPLGVDLFKRPDQQLAQRDNDVSAYIARAWEAIFDVYSRANRLLIQIEDSELVRDPDLYVLFLDSDTERIWITEPGLSGRNRIVFNKTLRTITWLSDQYTYQGEAFASMSTSFGAVSVFDVHATEPGRPDAEFYRQKAAQLKLGPHQEIPVYYQPYANLDYAGGSGAFVGVNDVMLSSDGSYVDLSSGFTPWDNGVYRYAFLLETGRRVRLYGSVATGGWPVVSATAATITGPGQMSWTLKFVEGTYTVRFRFADLSAATPDFQIRIAYNDSEVRAVYDGTLIYGYQDGEYIYSPYYVLTTDGTPGVFSITRENTNSGQLTIDIVEVAPLSGDQLEFDTVVSNGTNSEPSSFYGVPGRYDAVFYDFDFSEIGDVRFTLQDLSVGALYLKAWDIKRIEYQRQTPDTTGYDGWKRGWLMRALGTVIQSWRTVVGSGSAPDYLINGVWTSDSSENWMTFIEADQPRLRSAFRLARPSDVGQPALTPAGLMIDDSGVIGASTTIGFDPVIQALQPWMIVAGIYVASEDFWPTYFVADAVGLSTDFIVTPVIETPEPPPATSGELQILRNGDPVVGTGPLTSQLFIGEGYLYVVLKNIGDDDLTIDAIGIENETGPTWTLNNLPSLPLVLSPEAETDAIEIVTIVTPAPGAGDDGPSANFVVESTSPDSPRSITINTFEIVP